MRIRGLSGAEREIRVHAAPAALTSTGGMIGVVQQRQGGGAQSPPHGGDAQHDHHHDAREGGDGRGGRLDCRVDERTGQADDPLEDARHQHGGGHDIAARLAEAPLGTRHRGS
ncbi:MAG: hypothetical protein WCI83_03725, partial [Thermoleophilia bacterium]